jgi:hypothetical protein
VQLIRNAAVRCQSEDDDWHLVPKHGNKISINQTSALVWSLLDGNSSNSEICTLLHEAYPETSRSQLETEINELVANWLHQGLVQEQTTAEIKSIQKPDSRIVRYYNPDPELLWLLEQSRQFVMGVYVGSEIDRTAPKAHDLDETGLAHAIKLDLDKAGQDSCVHGISFKHLTRSSSFQSGLQGIREHLKLLVPQAQGSLVLTGHIYYPSGGHMGWHANHSMPGQRIYCSWAELSKANYFRYKHPDSGEIITEWEAAGWNIKSFTIPADAQRLWHCIYNQGKRFSLGFRVFPEAP